MARTKATLGIGARLADHLSASLLARVYPASMIEQILRDVGVESKRQRSLPMLTTSYYCIGLALYPECAYQAVFEALAEGLQWSQGGRLRLTAGALATVSKSSVSAARSKLGVTPLKRLHESACVALADPLTQPEAFYAGLRLVAIDGSHFELPDESDNLKAFGRPGSRTGVAAYPQAQCAVLVECTTHAILGAEIGAYRDAEWSLCEPLLERLDSSMLCLADRGFSGVTQWSQARATGAHLLWRAKGNRILPVLEALADGSYLSVIYPPRDAAGRVIKSHKNRTDGITVRVIEYSVPDSALGGNERGNKTGSKVGGKKRAAPASRYRLITSLLDPNTAPAIELATVYHERWEVEAVFDELKTHLVEGRRCLRSKTAEGVRQEFYGWVLAHYAVCWLMHQAASHARVRTRSLSFTGNLRLVRLTQPLSGVFPPSATHSAGKTLQAHPHSCSAMQMRE
jgi:Insertion element 4 transposase N-terminal/Transposase DDE domain